MVHLDRENGAILLPDGSVVPYDVLVLCTGLQVRKGFGRDAAPVKPGGAGQDRQQLVAWRPTAVSAKHSEELVRFEFEVLAAPIVCHWQTYQPPFVLLLLLSSGELDKALLVGWSSQP